MRSADLGVGIWKQAREFYSACDGPPADFSPIATEEGQLAHLPPKARRALLRRRATRKAKRIVERILGRRFDDL